MANRALYRRAFQELVVHPHRNYIISAIRKRLRETALDPSFDMLDVINQPDHQLQYKEKRL